FLISEIVPARAPPDKGCEGVRSLGQFKYFLSGESGADSVVGSPALALTADITNLTFEQGTRHDTPDPHSPQRPPSPPFPWRCGSHADGRDPGPERLRLRVPLG